MEKPLGPTKREKTRGWRRRKNGQFAARNRGGPGRPKKSDGSLDQAVSSLISEFSEGVDDDTTNE